MTGANFANSIDVSLEEAQAELDSVLADMDFHCTDRNRKFLRFVAEETFHGRQETIKAYSIAVDVFGRPASFDPSTDPIVRIEATRLRGALLRYYERAREHPVHIELPRGRYVPLFSRTAMREQFAPPERTETIEQVLSDAPVSAQSRLHPTLKTRWLAVSAGIAGAFLLAWFLTGRDERLAGGPVLLVSEKPIVAISIQPAEGISTTDMGDFQDQLLAALARFQTLRLVSPDFTTATSVGKSLATAPGQADRYSLFLKYRPDVSSLSVYWQVIDQGTGEAVRSGIESILQKSDNSESPDNELIARLAVRLASARGAINSIETSKELARPTLGNGCILRAVLALDTRDIKDLSQARACLEESIRVRPGDSDAYALLSAILLAASAGLSPSTSDDALALAKQAVLLNSDSDRSHFALMAAQFRAGYDEAAIAEGRRALDLNPYNLGGMAKLSRILFTLGNWDEGVAMASQAIRFEFMSPADATLTLAMDAYRRGDFDGALLRLQGIDKPADKITELFWIAALAQVGRIDEADTRIKAFAGSGFSLPAIQAEMTNEQLNPALVSGLQAGLARAGLLVE